jgi:hypothetical protein
VGGCPLDVRSPASGEAPLTISETGLFPFRQPGITSLLLTLDVVDVGPLAFGQAQSLGPITYEFTIDESLTPARATFYRIHVKVRDCRLSNGSVCGNNSHVYGFARPDSSQQALTARDSTPEPSPVPNSTIAARDPLISTPAKAGGLDRLGPTVTEEGDASNAAGREAAERARLIRVAEQIGVRELLSAGYVGGTQNLAFGGAALSHQVAFHGGEFVPQLEGQANDDSGQEILDEAFEATLGTAFGGDNSFEPNRAYDAGPLGGQLRCAIMTTALPGTTMQHPICGWVDERTIGYIRGSIVVGDAVGQSPANTEAEAARLLVQMRADIETIP